VLPSATRNPAILQAICTVALALIGVPMERWVSRARDALVAHRGIEGENAFTPGV
jgi:predicted permease